jgi:hypothetical protein
LHAARWGDPARRHYRATCAMLFFIALSSLRCLAADLILIEAAGGSSTEGQQLELAASFYGLNLRAFTAGPSNMAPILEAIRLTSTTGVAIEAGALPSVQQDTVLRALSQKPGVSVPLIVLGATQGTDPALLRSWSDGSVAGVKSLTASSHLSYLVGRVPGVTQQLADAELPAPERDSLYFDLSGRNSAQVVMSVRGEHQLQPVFIETKLGGQKVFLLCKTHFPAGKSADFIVDSPQNAFAEIAAVMMFSRYSAGERGWHALHHYANLTIDDPWLREPYGNLTYAGLLREMEKHNFHSTIAFIPWNFDRSEAEVVSLFRSNPDRFSICIHGDNHDHKEFTDYRDKPLTAQVAAMRQSVARMDKFQALTGIPYDRVMVFPHSVAPEKTLEALKANDYLATVNSQNFPMDAAKPDGLLFALRPTTLAFGGFPSILRVEVAPGSPMYPIAINEFLDNPVLFYSHQDLFASGINVFDPIADEVNKVEPDTKWSSLGDIVRHSYVVRLRDDSNYDVLAFSSSFQLENLSGRDTVYYVTREDSQLPAIASVKVDGRPVQFSVNAGSLAIRVPVPAGQSRSVVIQYQKEAGLATTEVAKKSFRVLVLRKASDFRDITLSRNPIGRALTNAYYGNRATRKWVILCGCGLIVLCIGAGWIAIERKKKADRGLPGGAARLRRRGRRIRHGLSARETEESVGQVKDDAAEREEPNPSFS